jgi:hypothetical protein
MEIQEMVERIAAQRGGGPVAHLTPRAAEIAAMVPGDMREPVGIAMLLIGLCMTDNGTGADPVNVIGLVAAGLLESAKVGGRR